MLDQSTLKAVAEQLLSVDSVELAGQKHRVRRTSSQHLKTVTFMIGDHEYTAIEQNPDKPSR